VTVRLRARSARQMGGSDSAQKIAPLQPKPFHVEIGEASNHVLDQPCIVGSRRQQRRCRAHPTRGAPHPVTPHGALWVSPRGALSSRAAHRRSALRRCGRPRCLPRSDSSRPGRSNRDFCRTDRSPSRSHACAAQSGRRVSYAEASPSQRSALQYSRRDPAGEVRRPARASSRVAERMTAGAKSRPFPSMKDQEPKALLTTSTPARRSLAGRRCRRHASDLSSHRSRSRSPRRRSVSAHRTARHRHRAARQALPLSP
jgi:hypothetical protein